MQNDMIRRFYAALPQVREWIDHLLESHASSMRKVSTLGFAGLSSCYPGDVLERAGVVSVERTPFPPVSQIGLPEFAAHEGRRFDGITFKSTFFVARGRESEALYFHELVHVVQWARLGVDNFVLAYGLGLLQFGYENSPLERMAYALEEQFKCGRVPRDLVRVIEEGTDDIWRQAAASLNDGAS
jgi:hypothetical protein